MASIIAFGAVLGAFLTRSYQFEKKDEKDIVDEDKKDLIDDEDEKDEKDIIDVDKKDDDDGFIIYPHQHGLILDLGTQDQLMCS